MWMKNGLLLQITYITFVIGASLDKTCKIKFDPKTTWNPVLQQEQFIKPSANEQNNNFPSEVEVPNGKVFRFECVDGLKVFRNFDTPSLDLECKGGILFSIENQAVFRDDWVDCIRDTTKPKSEVIRNGTCYKNATKVDVYFKNTDPAYTLYSVCFDEKSSVTLYSQSYIDGKSHFNGLLESGPRPQFKDTDFFSFDVKKAYTREQELETLADLLGSEEIVRKYVPSQQYFFSRGHLFPNGDPVFKYEKDATFYYINVVPQWQILNAGNWERLESSVRNLAKSLKSKVSVWTGTYGVLSLDDQNNNAVELWMINEPATFPNETLQRKLPVPKFMWKVIYDENAKAALAVVQINNPWLKILKKEDLLCQDICDRIPWLNFDTTVVKKGYTYCCDVNSLKKVVEYVPTLNYTRLLDYNENLSDNENVTDEDEDGSDEQTEDGENESISDSEDDDSDDQDGLFKYN